MKSNGLGEVGRLLAGVFGVFALFALLHGVSTTPNYGQMYAIATDVSTPQLGPEHHWLEQSFLLPLLGNFLGTSGSPELYIVYLVSVLVVALALIVISIWFFYDYATALSALAALAASGTIISASFWLGYSDAFSLLFGTGVYILLSRYQVVRGLHFFLFALGFLGAWAHFTQAVALLLVVALLLCGIRWSSVFQVLAVAGGLVIGKLVLAYYFQHNGFGGLSRFEYFSRYDVLLGMTEIVENRTAFLFSIFRFGWVIIFIALWAADYGERSRLGAAMLLLTLFSVTGTDHSRIASIVGWPVLLHGTLLVQSAIAWQRRLVLGISVPLVALSLLFPAYHVWGTEVFNGPLNDQAYRFAQNLYDKVERRTRERAMAPVIPGRKYEFDDSSSLIFDGFSAAESEHRWSLGRQSSIRFRVEHKDSFSGRLFFRVRGLGKQSVVVRLNGQRLTKMIVTDQDSELHVQFSPDALQNEEINELSFIFSNPHSPSETDPRELAMLIKWLMFELAQDSH